MTIQDQKRSIKVFLESPEWDTGKRWFQIPAHILESLFVTEYEIDWDVSDDFIQAEMEKLHPGHVFVY